VEKFSKLKTKDEFKEPKDEILYDGEHLKVIKYEDFSIVKEKDVVVCIPFFIETNQFLIRQEYIPSYKYVEGQEYYITVLSGGIEKGENSTRALLRELEEEAGIVIRDDYEFEELNPLFMHKGSANKYIPFIIPLNENDYHEVIAKGDGSRVEKLSKSVKVDVKYLASLKVSDLITDYMILQLKEYLNLLEK